MLEGLKKKKQAYQPKVTKGLANDREKKEPN